LVANLEAPAPARRPDPAALPVLPGHEILEELGRGGMGVVYKARQISLNRVVVIKMILAGAHAGPEERSRFRKEAEAVARLQHPHIIQIYEVSEHDGRPFLVLEFAAAGSLDRRLARQPQPPRWAAAAAETLARAVHHAHEHGIVHRDLKPANVLLQESGVRSQESDPKIQAPADSCLLTPDSWILKITDFGLAKLVTETTSIPTQSGAIMGTPSYMAPEQASGKARTVGPAADVYALGAILYEMLTGRPPFVGASVLEILEQVVAEEPVPVRRLHPTVPRDLATVCAKCLEKEPHRRYASAAELANDLRRFLRNEPVRARPAGRLYQLRKFAQRNKVLVGGVAAVFLALVLGIIGTSLGLARALKAETQTKAERDRALKAEREARRLLAESYVQSANLATQRGSWRDALKQIDAALAAGADDSPRLRLAKVRAWFAVNEMRQAERELRALSRRKDLGRLAASVVLWQADLDLSRSLGKEQQALAQVRRVKGQLAGAEADYAEGLLAQTTGEALAHFQKAIEKDRFHQRANAMAGLLLITRGQLPQALQHVVVAELLFPEDPTFKVLHGLICTLNGDPESARDVVNKAQGQLSPAEMKTAHAILEASHQSNQVVTAMGDGRNQSFWAIAFRLFPPLVKLWIENQGVKNKRRWGTAGLFLPIHPIFSTTFRRLPELLGGAVLVGKVDPAIEECARLARVHPDALWHFAIGLLHGMKGRLPQAEAAFWAARAPTPFAGIHKPALYLATVCEKTLLMQRRAGPEVRARAAQNVRRLALSPLTPEEVLHLSDLALFLDEVDLARWLVAEGQRRHPRDLRLEKMRLAVELRAGAYGEVLKRAKAILARNEKDTVAKNYRKRAVEQIRKQADALTPRP
jgi:hypothetical protein